MSRKMLGLRGIFLIENCLSGLDGNCRENQPILDFCGVSAIALSEAVVSSFAVLKHHQRLKPPNAIRLESKGIDLGAMRRI